jgi:RNA polymerase sigma factor (sigma-70 family)
MDDMADGGLSGDLARETELLRRIARGIVLEPGLAEDAVQEAWLAALRAEPAAARCGGWMTEAVRRIALGLRRGEARRASRERAAARSEAVTAAAESAARVELLRELLDALGRLDEPYRTAVQLRLVDDLPSREIAERTEVPVETARTRVKRGVQRLRAQLDARHANARDELFEALAPLVAVGGIGRIAGTLAGSNAKGGAGMGMGAKVAAAGFLAVASGLWWAMEWDARARGEVELAAAAPEKESGQEANHGRPSGSGAAGGGETSDRAAVGAAARSEELAPRWTLRVKTASTRSIVPNARFRLSLISGYDGEGEVLNELEERTGGDGAVSLDLPVPAAGFRIRVVGAMPDHWCRSTEVLVLRGKDPPSELVILLRPLDVTVTGRVSTESGEPIAGARVEGLDGEHRTDGDGRFSVRVSTEVDGCAISAYAPGFASRRLALKADAPGIRDGVEIRLVPGVVLRGRVVDEHGAPVAGARVSELCLAPARATTDGEGRFALDAVEASKDHLLVEVEAEGFAVLWHNFEDGRAPAVEVVLALERGRELRGRVVDEFGKPVPGALAYAGDGFWGKPRVADDDGRFTLSRVARSESSFTITADGFVPFEGPLPADESELDVMLSRGLSLSGTLVDDGGAPIPSATVSVNKPSDLHAVMYKGAPIVRTDASGHFEMSGIPAGASLVLHAHASGFTRAELPVDPARQREVRVVMQRSAGLAGRVFDTATRAPIRKFRVRFVAGTARSGERSLLGWSIPWHEGLEFESEDGTWDTGAEAFIAGQIVGIEVSAAGHGTAVVSRAETVLDPRSHRIEIGLDAGVRVRGTVVDARGGQPIVGALVRRFTERDELDDVWHDDNQGRLATVRTDENGAFVLDGLADEPMSLYVEAADLAPVIDGPFDPTTDGAPRVIPLTTGASVTGVLIDEHGVPTGGAVVVLAASSTPGLAQREWRAITGGDGRFRLDRLPAARYRVGHRIERGDAATLDLSRIVNLAPAGEHEVELRPEGRLTLRGSLQGEALPEAAVVNAARLDEEGRRLESRSTLAIDGRFEIRGVSPGRWEVAVYGLGVGPKGKTTVDLAESSSGEAVIDSFVGGLPTRER